MRTSWPWPMATVADQWRRSCSRHCGVDAGERAGSLPPPADAVGADELGAEAEHPRAVRLALARSVSISVDRVGVERDGAGVGRLRRRVAELAAAVARSDDLDRRVDRQHARRAGRSIAAPPARRGGRRRRRRCAASARRPGRSTRRRPSRRARRRASSRVRRCVFVDRSRAMLATLVLDPAPPDRLRQRGAQHAVLVLDAGVAPCPPRRRRVCHRSTSPTDRRASGSRAIWSFLMRAHPALLIARPTTAPTCRGSARPTRRARRRPTGRRATTRPGPTSSSAATRWRVALAAVDRLARAASAGRRVGAR